MSEFAQDVNLLLGLAGTITGAIALFISYWSFRKDRPNLNVTVTDCFHNFTVSKSTANRTTVSFWVDFLVKNKGFRGTTIEDIELTFESNGKTYKMRKQYYRGDNVQDGWISIPSSKSVDLSVDFWEEFTGNEEDKINCTFTIFHTYKAETIRYISVRKKSASH